MAKEKMVKRVVVHPKFYMMVEGKMTHIAVGTEVSVTEAEAEKKARKLADPTTSKALGTDGKLQDASAAAALPEGVQAAMAEMQKKVTDAEARATAAEAEAAKLKKAPAKKAKA